MSHYTSFQSIWIKEFIKRFSLEKLRIHDMKSLLGEIGGESVEMQAKGLRLNERSGQVIYNNLLLKAIASYKRERSPLYEVIIIDEGQNFEPSVSDTLQNLPETRKKLLYLATTRARHHLIVIGTKEEIDICGLAL